MREFSTLGEPVRGDPRTKAKTVIDTLVKYFKTNGPIEGLPAQFQTKKKHNKGQANIERFNRERQAKRDRDELGLTP